jgi:hypothetical protein
MPFLAAMLSAFGLPGLTLVAGEWREQLDAGLMWAFAPRRRMTRRKWDGRR